MAAVPMTFVGIATTDSGSTNVTLTGMASITGLGIGGGPIVPKPPVGIWPGPGDPDFPGGGKPPGGGGDRPEIWPKPGDPDFPGSGEPPVDPPVDPPYPGHPQWVWGWVIPAQKWMPVYVPGPTDPQPH